MMVLICIKLFDSLIVLLKESFKNVNFEKSKQITTKTLKITQHANVKAFEWPRSNKK